MCVFCIIIRVMYILLIIYLNLYLDENKNVIFPSDDEDRKYLGNFCVVFACWG